MQTNCHLVEIEEDREGKLIIIPFSLWMDVWKRSERMYQIGIVGSRAPSLLFSILSLTGFKYSNILTLNQMAF